jgi:hypothetical protein
MNGAYLGHVFATTDASADLQSYDMLEAINGYPAESTEERFTRICALRNIPSEVRGDTALATRMGPQRPGTMKTNLQDIQKTEQGLIFESAAGRGLVLCLRNYLYDQANTPALELDYPADTWRISELATSAELYNVIVAADRSGMSATAVEPAGRYGTDDPPDGCGYLDRKVDVNLYDPGDIPQLANAYLRYHQQTVRFGEITVDVDDNPGLRAAAEAVDVGMFIKLTGRTPDPVILLVTGISGRDTRTRYRITFTVAPGAVFATGTWADGVTRWGVGGCTLSAGVTSSAIALTLTQPAYAWSTTGEPYDLMIAGERVTVTTMNAATGSGPYTQTCTVTRAANGIVKALLAGAPVTIANGGTWGW